MKTLFITVAESSVTNNLLRGLFGKRLFARDDIRIVLIAPSEKVEEYGREFGRANVRVEAYAPEPFLFLERLNQFFAKNILRTGMVKFVQVRRLYADRNIVLYALKRILVFFFGRSRLFQGFVRGRELSIQPSQRIQELFNTYMPDAVFGCVANTPEIDVRFLREAKRRNIKTIGTFRGWDTFVAHGFIRVVPDILLLQDEYLKETGRAYQYISQENMRVVGFPSFDWYFRKDLIEPREVFLSKIGIDPDKRYILFGAMEYYWYERDGEIAEIFNGLVKEGKIPSDFRMLFRPYPGYAGPVERVKKLEYVVPDFDAFTLAHADTFEVKERNIAHLMNSIIHSEMVATVSSTIGIDGVALGKPALSIAFEETQAPYWFSIARFHDHCTHYEDVMKTGGIRRIDTREEFASAIKEYADNPLTDQEKRERLIQKFIAPFDGSAGERIAKCVEEALNI